MGSQPCMSVRQAPDNRTPYLDSSLNVPTCLLASAGLLNFFQRLRSLQAFL